MATSNAYPNPSDIEGYLRDLLECPICTETIKSVPVYQCANGHVICKDCIEKLNNCPICRNDSELRRSLKLENIVQRLEGIQPENVVPTTGTPNLQKWGMGSVRSYGTINEPNQAAPIGINLQANPGQATPWQASTRQTRRQARRYARTVTRTTRQILNRQVNNQAGLRIDRAENRPQSVGPSICDIMGRFIIFCACCILVMLFIFGLQNYT